MTNRNRLWLAAAIIAMVICIGFILSVPHARELPKASDLAVNEPVASVPTVALHDSYKKGTHTLTGSVLAPNACSTASAKANLVGAGDKQAILVSVTLTDDTTDVCLELPTKVTFSTTLAAPNGFSLQATVNGTTASTTGS